MLETRKSETTINVIFSGEQNLCPAEELLELVKTHTSNLSRIPRRYPCKIFLAGVNFYRFNAKNWHFRQILREKVEFITDLTQKNGIFDRFCTKKWRFLQI